MIKQLNRFNGLQDWLYQQRHKHSVETDATLITQVQNIHSQVLEQGDDALVALAQQFDGVTDSFNLVVSQDEIAAAYNQVSETYVQALKRAHQNIYAFHKKQQFPGWKDAPRDGVSYGVDFLPLSSVGLYVPGGRAVYPSTVLMNAIPAVIAGVEHIVITTPPQSDGSIHPAILVAADLCGVDTIIKSGGAQGIFALANGTQSVPKVDKIVGPGNKYVTLAKQLVYGQVDIDKPAGPSEVVVYIDNIDYASFAALELLAQCEHDPDASGNVVSTSETISQEVEKALSDLISSCKRQDIIKQALQNSFIYTADSPELAIEAVNAIASEHCVILSDKADKILPQINHGGSIFLGPYTPVALGDYYAGPNHVLPTSGTARFASPLGVLDFLKNRSYLTYSKDALSKTADDMKILTDMEELDAHYLTISKRLDA